MADLDIRFLDYYFPEDYIKVNTFIDDDGNELISINGLNSDTDEGDFCILLNKSTAIKFAKTLRTEINKIQ